MNTKMIAMAVFMATTGAALPTAAFAAVPVVTDVEMSQPENSRRVTISYTLSDAPAVVTFEVQTNRTGSATNVDADWVPIGGEAVSNAKGDVWKRVGDGLSQGQSFDGTITWRPDLSWPDHKIDNDAARAVVTAWALDNTPDYMVVDLSANAKKNTQKYYPAVEFLPGGLLSNDDYRTSLLVMRKIMAKDVDWTMGSTKAEPGRNETPEATHRVVLTNNYYIGVFELTQSQWALFASLTSRATFNGGPRSMRPIETVCYNELRMAALVTTAAGDAQEWPGAPYAGSFINLVRERTGLDFDLPSEAQWEFAARAGNGDGKWGDGSAITNATADLSLSNLACYKANPSPFGSGTDEVGAHAPNDWGLYDMHGNVYEYCLDWYKSDISSLTGRVNTVSATNRVRRGGAYGSGASACRSATRGGDGQADPKTRSQWNGFRLACQAGLQ